jgi:ketosteroid isomerase-like protein
MDRQTSAKHAAETTTRRPITASADNLMIVRAVFGALANRDVRAALEVADPRIEFFAPATAGLTRGGRSYRGYEGIFAYFRDLARVWDELAVVPHEFRDLGDEIVVSGRLRARALSGYLLDEPTQWVFRLRKGKVVWIASFSSKEQALEAVGLSDRD